MASVAEQAYTLEGVADGVRDDGRGCLDFRHLSLETGLFPQTCGSARLQVGGTDVLVAVSAELGKPHPDTPAMGAVLVSVDCGPGDVAASLPEYVAGGFADDKLQWLEAALAPLYCATSIPAALRTLCILEGAQCWQLRVHVQLLRCDGCPLDAIAIAVRAALGDTRVPKISVVKSDEGRIETAASGSAAPLDLDLDESLDESTPFDAVSLPLYITLVTIGGVTVADCTAAERCAAGSSLSLALDGEGRMCSLRAGGGYGLHVQRLAEMTSTARQLCQELQRAVAGAPTQTRGRAWDDPMAENSVHGLLA